MVEYPCLFLLSLDFHAFVSLEILGFTLAIKEVAFDCTCYICLEYLYCLLFYFLRFLPNFLSYKFSHTLKLLLSAER